MPIQDMHERDGREDEAGRNPANPPTGVGQVGGSPAAVVGDPVWDRPADTTAVKDVDPAEAEFEKRIHRPLGQPADTKPESGDPSA